MGEEFEAAICGDNYWWNSSTTRSSLFPFMAGSMTCSVAAAANDSASCWQLSDFMDFNNKGPTTTTRSSSSHEEQDTNNNNKCGNNNNNESSTSAAASGSIFMDSTLQMMAYGLSSSPPSSTTCWNNNPSLFGCNERSENNNFQSVMLEEERGLVDSSNSNSNKEFQLMSCVSSGFQIGSSSSYGYPSSTMIHEGGLFDPTDSSSSIFTPPQLSPTWSTVSSLMDPKQQQQINNNGLQFSNNTTTPFWNNNASSSPHHDIITSAVFSSPSSSQPHQYQTPPPPNKPVNAPTSTPLNKLKREESPEKASSGGSSKSASERAFKRTRIETPSPLPTFKVRKEKLGDRITALQQLVSPFGKTDTASVLHEAIEYIKFLHDQVNVLTTPYMKNGAPIIQHQQGCDNGKDSGGAKQDLRSRGLCLVPVASTFPMATETTADFWTPTFGGALIGSGR
ncbi:hypothetical protein PIB30_010250 [Stylosanthes scabra]|uniref:BHLH domain-containing protein n=1 Tax=Stylosanthes scabra TaxID=79078 RepID=A0ABU6S5A4_9FABA|nr:hypothetical protein [Stylosanthes scabra]